MNLRQWHTYIGAFIAPSLLFFAVTGTSQLFSLHESREGYRAPVLLQQLGSVHKDQVFKAEDHHAKPRAGPAPVEAADHHDEKPSPAAQMRIWILKWFFVVMALGLVTSTLIGLWMAFTAGRRKGVVLLLLLVGAAVPVLLLAL